MIEAHSVKHKILSYAFNERNYMAAVTEGLNNADVLGIDKRRRAIEFEMAGIAVKDAARVIVYQGMLVEKKKNR